MFITVLKIVVNTCKFSVKLCMMDLPEEVIEYILLFIVDDHKTWGNCRLVNKGFQACIDTYQQKKFTVQNNNKTKTITFHQGLPGQYYLTLRHSNISTYKLPSRGGWSQRNKDVKTTWHKIRVDPHTLLVHNGDFTFASSVGFSSHHVQDLGETVAKNIPYGCAFDCEESYSMTGVAKIDLRGTPFAVADDQFHFGGCNGAGQWKHKQHNQVVDLRGGGYCGWVCPKLASNEPAAAIGGWYLQLKLI
jgi:hypothetical protein